ncbi:unnamed protein product [Caenorhabditis sp. 36 PRJEB53466]|nr:unnamed protein product [Caenorhabditis sp. 36 PRJEB53466]
MSHAVEMVQTEEVSETGEETINEKDAEDLHVSSCNDEKLSKTLAESYPSINSFYYSVNEGTIKSQARFVRFALSEATEQLGKRTSCPISHVDRVTTVENNRLVTVLGNAVRIERRIRDGRLIIEWEADGVKEYQYYERCTKTEEATAALYVFAITILFLYVLNTVPVVLFNFLFRIQ